METLQRTRDIAEYIIEEKTPDNTQPVIKAAHAEVIEWITRVFQEVAETTGSNASFKTKRRNYFRNGPMLMSHELWIEDEDGNILLPDGHQSKPTVGIIHDRIWSPNVTNAPNLVYPPKLCVAKFQAKHTEAITGLSKYGVMMGRNEIAHLAQDHTITVPSNEEAWAVLESRNPEDTPLTQIQRTLIPRINGVYGCIYL